jgi:hypothetical protein
MAEQNRSGESRNGAERPCYYQTSLTELTKKDKRKKQKKNLGWSSQNENQAEGAWSAGGGEMVWWRRLS